MFINHSSKEVTAKIVYYGAGLSGKTTNLQYIFSITNPKSRGELVSVETDIERTLFFDLLPINVGLIKGYFTKFQLYTVPGQVFYNSTRKMVLKGADGIVFVADSQYPMESANLESLANLKTNLESDGRDLKDIPLVFQYNKQDLKNLITTSELNKILNKSDLPYFEAIARDGVGVVETLREISTLTLKKIKAEIETINNGMGEKPVVSFDINKDREMLKKKEISIKKISVSESSKSQPDKKESIRHESEDLIYSEPEIMIDDIIESEIQIIDEEKEKKVTEKIEKADFELLNNLKSDDSRITILKKIKVKDFCAIEFKDKDSKLLNSFKVKVKPGVKTINLIIDVED